MYYRRQAINTCGDIFSTSALVTVEANFTQSNPTAASICYNTTHTFNLAAATGGSGTLTYQWQSSPNNSTWSDISGATSVNYTTPALTSNMYYRRQAIRATCGGTITSNSALVTVEANFTQSNPTAASICYNTTHTFNLAVATGGSGTISYQWEQSSNNSTWANAVGTSTNANYTTPALTSNMYYRRKATAATCGGTITSVSALVTVASDFTQNSPTEAGICYNTTHTFNLVVATGGSGTISYQWEQSSNNSIWANAVGTSTNANYTTPALTSNMYYRRKATAAACGGTITSVSALVTVAPDFTQSNPTAASICYNTTHTFNLAAAIGGSGTISYQWEQSPNNSTWSNAVGTSTNANYTTPALTSNMYYRRKATAATCGGTIISASALVTVATDFTQSNPAAVSICYNTEHTFNLAAATGGSGTISYQWEQSPDNTNWSNAIGASTTANYTTPALISNMYYRRKATAATCGGTIISVSAMVTVAANFTQSNPTAASICYNTTHTFNLAVATGGSGTISYQWEQSSNNSTWTNAVGTSTNANYTTSALTSNMYYRRKATATTCGGTITSASALVTVATDFTQSNPTAANICYNTTHTFNLAVATGGSGTISYQWEQSPDNTNWSNATGTSTTANYITPALTSNMYYRRKATATTCGGTITSTSALMTVTNPPTAPTNISGNTTICSGSSTTLYAIGGSEGSGCTYQWYSDGCGSGSILGTQSSLDIEPTVNTTYYVRRVGISPCAEITTDCASVTVTVNNTPTAPTGIDGITDIFEGEYTTLTAVGGSVGSGCTYQWYSDGCGSGNVLSTSSSLNINPTITTTFFVRRIGLYPCNDVITNCVSITVTVTPPIVTYIISATAGANGNIDPVGNISVIEGENQFFSFDPNSGYKIDQVFVDGVNNPSAVTAGSYTFENVTSNHSIFVTFTLITGIEDDIAKQLQIFPNPTNNEIFIKSDLRIEKVEVYSLLGSLLISESNFMNKLSVSNLSRGVYLLKIYTDKGMVVSKIVKE